MDKRLAKRHKRQVARAKAHAKLSEPDVRTPEQIAAAREASRPYLKDKNPWPVVRSDADDAAKDADDTAKGDGSE